MTRPVLALDLGGTQLRTALVAPDGEIRGRIATRTPGHAEALVEASVTQLRATLSAGAPTTSPAALGISAPGPLEPFTGKFIDPPNVDRSLRGFPFAQRVGAALGIAAVMERDTQVAVLAEGNFGAARGLSDYVYLTVSTGIGGGVVSGGRLLRGADGLANELGHITVDIDGPLCGCGAPGHLEAIASGTGIANAARAAGLGGPEIGARDVALLEQHGNAAAAAIMERARAAFAAAVVSIVDLYNPELIIVGGGVAIGQGDRLLEPARVAVHRYAFRRQAERVRVVPAQLGDDVGLIGALSLVELAGLGDH